MKFDRQQRPATETPLVVSYGGKTIPRWRTAAILKIDISPYLSEISVHSSRFLTGWTSRDQTKKLHWTDSEFDRTYFLWFLVFVSLLFVTLSNYKVCDNETLWSSIIFKTIMVSLHRGRFVVVHLCSSFPMDPQNFFSRGEILPKITIFGDFWSRTATFIKLQRWNFAQGCGPGAPSPGKIL